MDGGETWSRADTGISAYPDAATGVRCIQEMGRIVVDPSNPNHVLMSRVESPGTVAMRFSENEVINLQVRWDMGWYFGIAVDGYHVETTDPRAQQNIVFFPAFPMATRVVARLLGGTAPAFIAAGTIVALGAFFAGKLSGFLYGRFADRSLAVAHPHYMWAALSAIGLATAAAG